MKKKITTAMLIAAMSMSIMACGGDKTPETQVPTTEAPVVTETVATTEAPVTTAAATETKAAVSDYTLDLSGGEYLGEIDTGNLELRFGELLSVISPGDGVVVVKAKIQPSYSNKTTIDQNYYSVCDLIRKNGFNQCSELQYWAVADMTDGSESKVISFTLNSNTIQDVYNENIIDNQLGDYVDDLYILPSLQN